MQTKIDLKQIAVELAARFPAIQSLWIFGSRRFGTRSLRSDIDLLVLASDHLRPGDLRKETRRICGALDLFLADGGKAVSCMNESFVQAASFDELTRKLDAKCFWARDPRQVTPDAPTNHEIIIGIDYPPTVLLTADARPSRWRDSVNDYFRQVESELLPIKPFLGDSLEEVAELLLQVCERMVATVRTMSARKTRASWKPAINSEYDFQNLFFITAKPWIQDLGREEVTVRYDGQDKRSDFSVLQSRIVIEMKFVSDAGTKASVAKTLKSLADFYMQHPNIKVLLVIVFARASAEVDAAKWAADFSYIRDSQRVIVRVITIEG